MNKIMALITDLHDMLKFCCIGKINTNYLIEMSQCGP